LAGIPLRMGGKPRKGTLTGSFPGRRFAHIRGNARWSWLPLSDRLACPWRPDLGLVRVLAPGAANDRPRVDPQGRVRVREVRGDTLGQRKERGSLRDQASVVKPLGRTVW